MFFRKKRPGDEAPADKNALKLKKAEVPTADDLLNELDSLEEDLREKDYMELLEREIRNGGCSCF